MLFDMPEEDGSNEKDELNEAFSSLILQKGELSSSMMLMKSRDSNSPARNQASDND